MEQMQKITQRFFDFDEGTDRKGPLGKMQETGNKMIIN